MVYICIIIKNIFLTLKTNKMATAKTKQEIRREQAMKLNELTKTCPKEQAKLKRQLIKLGLYF